MAILLVFGFAVIFGPGEKVRYAAGRVCSDQGLPRIR